MNFKKILNTFFILASFVSGIAQVSNREALIALYESTGGESWTNTINSEQPWLVNDPDSSISDWFGVTVEDGLVTRLDLPNNNLSGQISPLLFDIDLSLIHI